MDTADFNIINGLITGSQNAANGGVANFKFTGTFYFAYRQIGIDGLVFDVKLNGGFFGSEDNLILIFAFNLKYIPPIL